MKQLIVWQRAEAGLVFIGALALFWQAGGGLAWWAAVLLFFAPDLSFAFYGLGNKAGALAYNLVHTYAGGLAVFALGLGFGQPLLASLGALWLGHSGFDRMLGYGLKSSEGFAFTHLGTVGKKAKDQRPA
jgi:hypothetical protein